MGLCKNVEMNTLSTSNYSPSEENNHPLVSANYSKLSDHIRRLTPQGIQCSVFCGGTNCKYENPDNWTADSLAIQGIYSHWITADILAMARPSTIVIVKKNIIQQFESLGIKSIINLQCPREHASCGQPLEESGFSYDPNAFMENNIYYYNFAWKDYGDASLSALLDMVKVIAFAVSEGRVAVHCHAGLGRTGVLIACYLVYSLRVNANDAIRFVRYRRPGSVQTRGQILCVRQFATFILPQIITFFIKDNAAKDKYMVEFTLKKFLKKQRCTLHGYEERNFKYLPKIVHVICERILKLCGCWTDEFKLSNLPFTNQFFTVKTHGKIKRHESTYSISSVGYPDMELAKSAPVSPNVETRDKDAFSEISALESEELTEEVLLENKCFQELETQKNIQTNSSFDEFDTISISEAAEVLFLNTSDLDEDTKIQLINLKNEINTSQVGWMRLASETDIKLLVVLLYEWLESLKIPVVRIEYLEHIVVYYKQAEACFRKFDIEDAYLVEYLLHFLSKLQPIDPELHNDLLKKFIAILTRRNITIRNRDAYSSEKDFHKLHEGTLSCTVEFFEALFELIQAYHAQELEQADSE